MSEKPKHTQEQVFLLEAARKKKQEQFDLKASIDEARTHIPELKVRVEDLLGIPPVQPKVNRTQEQIEKAFKTDPINLDMGKIMNEMRLDMKDDSVYFYNRYVIPGSSADNSVTVQVCKGLGREQGYKNDDLTVIIPDLGMKLILPDRSNNARVESIERSSKSRLIYDSDGVPAKSWAEWRREVTMEDYRHFDALLDRLTRPDVEKKEVSRPTRRVR